jgi:hypothetical protein
LLHETGCAKRLAVRLPVSLRLGVAISPGLNRDVSTMPSSPRSCCQASSKSRSWLAAAGRLFLRRGLEHIGRERRTFRNRRPAEEIRIGELYRPIIRHVFGIAADHQPSRQSAR